MSGPNSPILGGYTFSTSKWPSPKPASLVSPTGPGTAWALGEQPLTKNSKERPAARIPPSRPAPAPGPPQPRAEQGTWQFMLSSASMSLPRYTSPTWAPMTGSKPYGEKETAVTSSFEAREGMRQTQALKADTLENLAKLPEVHYFVLAEF